MKLRVAHISDLHFHKISLNPMQFFSKRWLGMVNLLLFRRKTHHDEQVYKLIDTFKEQQISHIIISGDMTTTSLKREMKKAKKYVQQLEDAGFKVFLIPGNHDHYTKSAYKSKLFYNYFPASYPCPFPELASFNLKEHGITVGALDDHHLLVLVDTTIATPWILSTGLFSETIESHLRKVLSLIPSSHSAIVVNHFPFFQYETPRRRLHRGDALRQVLEEYASKVKLYLHGHTHRHTVADLRVSNLPIILDSGSVSYRHHGTWNLLLLDKNSCELQAFSSTQTRHKHLEHVVPFLTQTFNW